MPRARCSSTCAPTSSSTRRTSPGSVCITALRAGFGTKLAWLADREKDVVFIGRDDDDAATPSSSRQSVGDHAHRRLPRRRHDELARGAPRGRPIERLDVDELHERWEARSAGPRRAPAAPSGTRATSRPRCSCPTTTSTELPEGHEPGDPRRGHLRVAASGRRSARRCSRASASPRSYTSSMAGWARGAGAAGRSRRIARRRCPPEGAFARRYSRTPSARPAAVGMPHAMPMPSCAATGPGRRRRPPSRRRTSQRP